MITTRVHAGLPAMASGLMACICAFLLGSLCLAQQTSAPSSAPAGQVSSTANQSVPAQSAAAQQVTGPSTQQQPVPAAQITAQDILTFLNQTISWQRHFAVEQQLASETADVIFLNDNRQLSNQIVRLSFDFARAEADLLSGQAPTAETSANPSTARLSELATKAEQQLKQAQAELESLGRQLDTATGKKRRVVEAAISETESELELAQARRDAMRNMVQFIAGAGSSASLSGNLKAQIEELQRAVPTASLSDKDQPSAATATAADVAASTSKRRDEGTGLLTLITNVSAVGRKVHQLDETIQITDQLADASKNLRTPVVAGLRQLTQKGDVLASQPPSDDPATLGSQKKELDSLTAQFKSHTAAVLPLAKQRVLLDVYKRSLSNWRAAAKSEYSEELKTLAIRLVALAIVLVLVLAGSEVWQKTILRYVRDPHRRYQFGLIRKIIVWFVIAIVLLFAFVSQMGSLATFAGLITAGLALALQNVILSVAGYFYLIGKYGVRVGDRVNVAGVTGEVADIGLVRLHLIELASGESDARPTGRVVVFSNSVVFQPTAGLYKQIPGTNFRWHEIRLTVAPEGNYQDIEERLKGVVESVFEEYRDRMEKQSREIERNLHLSVQSLKPQSRLRLTKDGLEVVLRYPVDLEDATVIDDKIARNLLEAIERDPKLRLVGAGTPNIQAVPAETVGAESR
jgi:small-conductance mechanosensitive channel